MRDFKQLLAEQHEEARAGIEEGLKAGRPFKEVMQDAAIYGVKPEEVAAIRDKEQDHENEGMER